LYNSFRMWRSSDGICSDSKM